MNNRPIIVLLIIILVITIGFNLHTLNRIDRLENSINNIHYTYNSMENRISGINQAINNTLRQVKDENQWINSSKIELVEFIDYLPNRKEVEAEITIDFSEIKNDEILYLKISGDETEDLIQLENYQENLSYKKIIRLDADENYEFKLIGETEEKTRSRDLEALHVKTIMEELIKIEPRIYRSTYGANKNYQDFNFQIFVEKHTGKDKIIDEYVKNLEIESAKAYIYVGDQLVDTLDLFNGTNWTNIKNENATREEVARESNVYREILLDIEGLYQFEENYKNDLNLKIQVVVEDNNGNIYKSETGF